MYSSGPIYISGKQRYQELLYQSKMYDENV